MKPRTEQLSSKLLVGKRLQMSYANNRTYALWSSFMPQRHAIPHRLSEELWSMEQYPPGYFHKFNPETKFEKWAAVEVSEVGNLPAGMEKLEVPGGLYAVFLHKGPASSGPQTYQYIFGTWLPQSGYEVDERPHFAIMGDKYKHEDPDSEEELWVPVRTR